MHIGLLPQVLDPPSLHEIRYKGKRENSREKAQFALKHFLLDNIHKPHQEIPSIRISKNPSNHKISLKALEAFQIPVTGH